MGDFSVRKAGIAAVLYAISLLFSFSAQRQLRHTQVVLDGSVSGNLAGQVWQMEEKVVAPTGFCFWGEGTPQLVTCRETGGAAEVIPVLFSGNPELLDAGILTWQQGCLVDRRTALELFGTASVGGQVLWQGGKAYPVRGILEAPRPVLVRMAAPEETMDRLVLALPPEEGAVAGAQCLLRWGIPGTVLDAALLESLVCNLRLLAPGLLAILVCRALASGWRKLTWTGALSGTQRRLLGRVLLAGAVFWGSLWLLGRQVVIPRSMLPSRWSDFSFWGRWWAAEKENAIRLLMTPLGNGQLQMGLNVVKSVGMNLAACLVLLWPTRRSGHADFTDGR